MTAQAAQTPRLTAENIFYNGFAAVTPLQTTLHASYLDQELESFVPDTPSTLYYTEAAKTQRLQRQLIALTMVLGRRLDHLNSNVKTAETTAAEWSKVINDNLVKITAATTASQNAIVQQQQTATQSIVQALKGLQTTLDKAMAKQTANA